MEPNPHAVTSTNHFRAALVVIGAVRDDSLFANRERKPRYRSKIKNFIDPTAH
jgi:hypothetical protein